MGASGLFAEASPSDAGRANRSVERGKARSYLVVPRAESVGEKTRADVVPRIGFEEGRRPIVEDVAGDEHAVGEE